MNIEYRKAREDRGAIRDCFSATIRGQSENGRVEIFFFFLLQEIPPQVVGLAVPKDSAALDGSTAISIHKAKSYQQ